MFCGIDLGSRNVKLVIIEEDKVVFNKIYDTVSFYKQYGKSSSQGLTVDFALLGVDPISKVVATGYGRNTLDIVGARIIPELKAHVVGAIWQTGIRDFTLLDLGGQDSKVVKVRKGKMVDFETNDKCAASTGRYLENMAQVLEISLEELSKYFMDPVELTSTCAIFGESELISKIVEGHSVPKMAAGINYSIFKRIKPMLVSLKSEIIIFTGGVAQGQALRQMITEEMGVKVIVPQYPQLNGAIGCAVEAGLK